MRYHKDHKQATRQHILEAAGRRFKQDGIDGAGVAAVMSDAGLTNGAFYAHFASKEDLVANVLADQLRTQRQSFHDQPTDLAGLEAFIRSYLSPQHRDQSADGCPSAALLDEIARAHADEPLAERCDRLLARFGREILSIVPGRVSTEVDARLSFDCDGTIAKAQHLIGLYEAEGVERHPGADEVVFPHRGLVREDRKGEQRAGARVLVHPCSGLRFPDGKPEGP